MRALVTGATGCVGANIVEALLDRGCDVRALQRKSSRLDALVGLAPEMVVGDVMDYPSLLVAMEGCDWVFHAAAISQYWRNKEALIYKVNVEGTKNVLRAAKAQGVRRVVYTSSVGALSLHPNSGQLIDEACAFDLSPQRFPYGYSKVLAEAAVREAVGEGLDAVIVNPSTVIGQRDIGFVGGEFLRAARQGKAVLTPPGGMGIVSARTVGVGHVLAAGRGRTGERYILNGENVTYAALMAMVADMVGARRPWGVIPRPVMRGFAALLDLWHRLRGGMPGVDGNQARLSAYLLHFDGSKAERELGFPHVSARAAVEEAWAWYRAQGLL